MNREKADPWGELFSMVAGEGFEPSKAEPGDLQSPPIGRSGNPPGSYKSYGALVVRGANDTLGT